MFIKSSVLKGFKLGARDGEIGRVKDFYFDDQNWVVRYVVADTGGWLTRKQVLLSPHAVQRIDTESEIVEVNLDKQQIEASPSIDEDQPVSREYETRYYRHYGWPAYWRGSLLWGAIPYPAAYPGMYTPPPGSPEAELMARHDYVEAHNHLRSANAVSGHNVQARDGEIGHVEDFIVDGHEWLIRYLVLDTRNWWPGKKVLIAPEWIKAIDWQLSKVDVDLDRDTIKQAPGFEPAETQLTRDYEENLYRHYHREPYWRRPTHAAA